MTWCLGRYLWFLRAMSCCNEDCNLCKNSITRQCPENDFFEDKYVRGRDPVAAKCGGSIQVCLMDRSTGQICNRDVDLRVLVVNGHLFDREFGALEDQICVDHVYEKLQIFANQVTTCTLLLPVWTTKALLTIFYSSC